MEKDNEESFEGLQFKTDLSGVFISLALHIAHNKARTTRILGIVERIYSEMTDQELDSIQKESDERIQEDRKAEYYSIIGNAVDDEETREKIIEYYKSNVEKTED